MRFQVSNIHVISNYLKQLFLISERHHSHHRRISYDEANSHNQDSAGTMRRKGMEIELLCFSNIAQRQDGCLLPTSARGERAVGTIGADAAVASPMTCQICLRVVHFLLFRFNKSCSTKISFSWKGKARKDLSFRLSIKVHLTKESSNKSALNYLSPANKLGVWAQKPPSDQYQSYRDGFHMSVLHVAQRKRFGVGLDQSISMRSSPRPIPGRLSEWCLLGGFGDFLFFYSC